MLNNGLQRASRCGARGTRPVSTAAGPVIPQARGCASAAADRMDGGGQLLASGAAAALQ
jgi:hypothetical protein